jgi:hypothetical protein
VKGEDLSYDVNLISNESPQTGNLYYPLPANTDKPLNDAAFYSQLKSKVGHLLAEAVAPLINLNMTLL